MSRPKKLEDFSINELYNEIKLRENTERSLDDIADIASERTNGELPVISNEAGNEALRAFKTSEIIESLKSKQKVIWGEDNRIEIRDIEDPDIFNAPDSQDILSAADSVVALFKDDRVIDNGNGTSTLQTEIFGTARRLCSTEKFRHQPIGAFCSGFLVAPDVIATAGHCVTADNVTNIRFVFGFRMIDDSKARTDISNSEIYKGAKLIGRQETESEADWALVQLDRVVTNHKPVPIRRTGKIGDNESLYVIGHPVGLPTKFADGANVKDNENEAYFVATLDTYGGNSGSPVFNREKHIVEGILVRGATDFVMNGNCRVSLICSDLNCNGEDCTRTTLFADLVPIIDM
ncbi:serine protease [Bacillus toyonensis]|uniref:trypsin-like serine peptidase n=1 Tax=Bacillus toyonensis TaxID=155322 RepID=UPI000CD91729|nr:serine protease [Bacillus toyonensis]MED3542297.1 serine protease [Bacillus toyonensis]MEE2020830.1 serine protease [Bacillus toyonensis]